MYDFAWFLVVAGLSMFIGYHLGYANGMHDAMVDMIKRFGV